MTRLFGLRALRVPLSGLLACLVLSPASRSQEVLPTLARVGPWPVVSHLIGYQDRLWLANSVKGVNHNSADLYSYDPASGALRYERHLFSQDAGRPVVAGGLLYWPFEDARSSMGFGHFMVTDGTRWQLGTIPTAQTFHTHAMAALDGHLIAATSAWHAGFQRSDDQGLTWREVYDHPAPERRVTRIVRLAALGDLLFGALVSRDDPGLVLLEDGKVSKVPGWPHARPIAGLVAFEGAIYGLVREAGGNAIWRTDGRQSRRLAPPRSDWPVQAIAAGDGGLWAVTTENPGGTVWHSAEGTSWDQAYRLEGGRPFEIAAYQGGVYVGGTGEDGQGILWGRKGTPAQAEPTRSALPVGQRAPARDWTSAGETLDRLLRDPATYRERGRGLRDLVFALARDEPPEDFFAKRLSEPLPKEEIDVVGGKVEAAQYARWILLWGMALAGSGHVPPALLTQPWTRAPNRPEKYFETAPAAMWTVAMTGQRDRATIDALIGRLERDDEPLWLRGDAIGALSAVTGQRFGYDMAAWQDWWRAGGEQTETRSQ